MPEGAVMWSCPRCGAQNAAELERCSRCSSEPAPGTAPLKKCPACRHEFDEPAQEGKVRCPSCGNEFEDYEEWVRRCRAAAFAATRPAPPPPEEPPPRPPHLKAVAASLLAMAALYAVGGALVGRTLVTVPCLALAFLQALAGVALLQERRHADALVRVTAGSSALLPLFVFPALYFVGLFAFFSRPMVVKYFGGRVDPLPDRLRHPMIAWLLVSLGIVAALFAAILTNAVEVARRWNDPMTPRMQLGVDLVAFFSENWWWAPTGVLAGICILALWGKVNRHGFLGVSVLSILGVFSLGAPPVVDAWFFAKSAKQAETYLQERDVQRLLWGVREGEPDPKVRLASLLSMPGCGRSAKVLVPALLRSIKDPDRRVRLAAAAALAQYDPTVEKTLPLLLGALEDDRSSMEEKDRAAVALGYFGPRARPALSPLLERFRQGDAATPALVEMGPASIPGLTAALRDPDPKVRRRAARALRLHGAMARSAVPALLERLKDDDLDVRTAAIAALGELDRDKAVPVLLDVLRQDKPAAKAAAEALCALGRRDGLAELPQGCSSMNLLRTPTLWDHLNRTAIDKDLEGTGAEILADAAERAALCLDLASECAEIPAMTSFRRLAMASRKRSVLDVILSFELDFVLESDRVRILPPEQARAFWTEWLAEQRKKRE